MTNPSQAEPRLLEKPRSNTCSIVRDQLGRPLTSLRISVTDRCNLRCSYCMPHREYAWLPRETLLNFDEIVDLAEAFCGLGTRRIRLTGGEPLLRPKLDQLVARLADLPQVLDLGLTTNGSLLKAQARALHLAGLGRATISLDTLRPSRHRELTRRDNHARILAGIDAARDEGFRDLKINVVLMRGFNDDEILEFLEFGRRIGFEVRFIEYMDVGGATGWNAAKVFSRAEVLRKIESKHGPISAAASSPCAPADRFQLADGTHFGIIASTTRPFCATCDRSRLTADGTWFHCLYAKSGTDLRTPLRTGCTPQELSNRLAAAWSQRNAQGAQQRQAERKRGPLATSHELRNNPHMEMHTRGG